MQMDSAYSMLESSVMMAPIERRVSEFYDSGRIGSVVVTSSTSVPAYDFRLNIVSYNSSIKDIDRLTSAKKILALMTVLLLVLMLRKAGL